MSDKQLTCPLCGHEMTAIETYPGRGELYCGKCGLTIGGSEPMTLEELTFFADDSEIVRIKNENNILRAARDMAVEDAKSIVVRLSNTRAENAKLRALVESYGMIANEAVCDYYDRDEMLADANATACELGIEVGA